MNVMATSSVNYLLFFIVLVLLYLLLRGRQQPTQEGPIAGIDVTPPGSAQKKWDCSTDHRQIILTNVPPGYTPYLYPMDEDDLREKPLVDFKTLISIVADIHLHNDNDSTVDKVDLSKTGPIKKWIGYNAQDVLALENSGHTVDDLTPVKCVPVDKYEGLAWRTFPDDSVNYEYIRCGEVGGFYITIDDWSDPPEGLGIK